MYDDEEDDDDDDDDDEYVCLNVLQCQSPRVLRDSTRVFQVNCFILKKRQNLHGTGGRF